MPKRGGVIGVDAFITNLPLLIPPLPLENANVALENAAPSRFPCNPNTFPQLVSLDENGNQFSNLAPYSWSGDSIDISADGRYVVFQLTFGDYFPFPPAPPHVNHIYVRDRLTCTTTLVSVAADGTPSDIGTQSEVSISGDGRYVVFYSSAINLVPNDTNGVMDVFVRDLATATTTRVSVDSNGLQGNADSVRGIISQNGRFVVFASESSNLVVGDTDGLSDTFVHDLQTGITTLASIGMGGDYETLGVSQGGNISADGRYIVFGAIIMTPEGYTQVIDTFVRDLQAGITTLVSGSPDPSEANTGFGGGGVFSANGRYVVLTSTRNYGLIPDDNIPYSFQYFIRDLQTGGLSFFDIRPPGIIFAPGYPGFMSDEVTSISADGRYILLQARWDPLLAGSYANISDAYVHDRQTGQTYKVSVPHSHSPSTGLTTSAVIADNAPIIAFNSTSSGLVAGDLGGMDIFVTSTNPPLPPTNTDTIALFNPSSHQVSLIDTVADVPPPDTYTTFTANARASGQWVMGDWDGDGDDTPGVYEHGGAFMYTNDLGPTATWRGVWFGLVGRPPVVGRFDTSVNHDCLGVVDQAQFPTHGTGFALYYTCNLTGSTTPPLGVQWLGFLLQGDPSFVGNFQFAAGDFDADGIDTLAIRRGIYVAWTNVVPTTFDAAFGFAQFWTIPFPPTDYGLFISGDWNNDTLDSFGFVFQNGDFYYRDDVMWGAGWPFLQHTGLPVGTPVQAASWR